MLKVCFDRITCKQESESLRNCFNSRAFGHDAPRDYLSIERAERHWKRDTPYPRETLKIKKRYHPKADGVEISFASSQEPITVEFIACVSSYRGFDSPSTLFHRVVAILNVNSSSLSKPV